MEEKVLMRKDLEEIFAGFEKRQDERFKALEGQIEQVDHKMVSLEVQIDQKMTNLEDRMDHKITSLEGRIDQKMTSLEGRMDQKMESLEGRIDQKMASLEDRMDQKMTSLELRVIDQFHILSEGLMDQIKLLAEGHAGVIDRLNSIDKRLDYMEKENERQHLETRAIVKLSFSELDRRLTDLESQMKEMQEWRKQVESRFPI